MKPMALAGVVLIALGIGGLLLEQFSYTTEKKVIDVGPLTASVDQKHNVDIPDIAGFGAILVGGLLIFLGRRTA